MTRDGKEPTMSTDVAELIPVRALNQVSYCPRLYFLEYVEAVMPINEHVEDGLFQHRRVNDPGLANRASKEGDALRTRSVSLSSERLGINGKLDLLEEKGAAIRPVEYKRSVAPKDEEGRPVWWENDAIQLCAQGLLVEEGLGVAVPGGILYYIGSKARVEVPFDESLRAKTLAAIALIRELSAREVAPEPLPAELRHRCFGCSLAPICLPEETLYLIHQPAPEPGPDGLVPEGPPSLGEPLTQASMGPRRFRRGRIAARCLVYPSDRGTSMGPRRVRRGKLVLDPSGHFAAPSFNGATPGAAWKTRPRSERSLYRSYLQRGSQGAKPLSNRITVIDSDPASRYPLPSVMF
jgi:CRISPR-associated protein Cas4